MSVRITGYPEVSLYDSVTGRAFGPVFGSILSAGDFLDWLQVDARTLTADQLEAKYNEWIREAFTR